MKDKMKKIGEEKPSGSCLKTDKEKNNSLIKITTTREDFKRDYTLRARVGIRIACFIGLVELKFKK